MMTAREIPGSYDRSPAFILELSLVLGLSIVQWFLKIAACAPLLGDGPLPPAQNVFRAFIGKMLGFTAFITLALIFIDPPLDEFPSTPIINCNGDLQSPLVKDLPIHGAHSVPGIVLGDEENESDPTTLPSLSIFEHCDFSDFAAGTEDGMEITVSEGEVEITDVNGRFGRDEASATATSRSEVRAMATGRSSSIAFCRRVLFLIAIAIVVAAAVHDLLF